MKNLIEIFEKQFLKLHLRSVEFIKLVPTAKLYWQPREKDALFPVNSCGEYILRSAAAIEWTLPEQLSSNELILEYLAEVEVTRQKGFSFFNSDDDLGREIPAPERLR